MKNIEYIERYQALKEKAGDVGITLKIDQHLGFHFKDIPGSAGVIVFKRLIEAESFVYGYEFGYKSGLTPDSLIGPAHHQTT